MRSLILWLSLLLIPPGVSFGQNKVPGIELPENQEVVAGEGFVTVTAKGEATEVKFIVLGTQQVKYSLFDRTVVVAVPSTPGARISVFAVGIAGGKLTEVARHDITVKGSPPPGPGPQPSPSPSPEPAPAPPSGNYGKLHLSIVEDSSRRTPELARLITSPTLGPAVQKGGHSFRVFDAKDPALVRLRFDKALEGVALPALIVQDAGGKVVPRGKAVPVPVSEQEFLDLVRRLSGS